MRAQTIDVKLAMGRILCSTIFRPGGKKLLAKGHVISEEDARMLETEGLAEVWVTELEDGEVGEDEAVMEVATEIGCQPKWTDAASPTPYQQVHSNLQILSSTINNPVSDSNFD